jgi:hypothetical protein
MSTYTIPAFILSNTGCNLDYSYYIDGGSLPSSYFITFTVTASSEIIMEVYTTSPAYELPIPHTVSIGACSRLFPVCTRVSFSLYVVDSC